MAAPALHREDSRRHRNSDSHPLAALALFIVPKLAELPPRPAPPPTKYERRVTRRAPQREPCKRFCFYVRVPVLDPDVTVK